MIIKGKSITHKMNCGIHLAKILDMKWRRDAKGEIMNPENPSIEIIFQNKEQQKIALVLSSDKSSQWITDLLCNALEVQISVNGKIDAEEMIGKKLWIVVANEYIIHNGYRRKDSTGSDLFYTRLLMKFFKNEPIIDEKELTIYKETI